MDRARYLCPWICLDNEDRLPEIGTDAPLLLFSFYEIVAITVMMT